jgi:hypothetical protein
MLVLPHVESLITIYTVNQGVMARYQRNLLSIREHTLKCKSAVLLHEGRT